MTPSNKDKVIQGDHILNIEGFLRSLTEEPTYTPRRLIEQVVLVTSGGSTATYFYDTADRTWKYTTLT